MPVRKHNDGYMVDVRINGERVRKVVRTKKEADALEKELIASEVNGTYRPMESAHDITFSDFIPTYLEWARTNKATKTAYDEESNIRAHLLPFFGKYLLSRITPQMVESFKIERQKTGVKPRTINVELTLLSVIFKTAIVWNHVRDNPVKRTRRLKLPQRRPRYLTEDEIVRLLSAAKETWAYL